MRKGPPVVALAMVIGLLAFVAGCGGADKTSSTAAGDETTAASSVTTAVPMGEPIKIGFDGEFTGSMAHDCALAEKGILTALAMLDHQIAGRPVEYITADNGSDVLTAVDKARELAESDKISFMAGPVSSSAAGAVTDYLSKSTGIPQCSIMSGPSDNLLTASKLAFAPNGLYGSHGYYLGKYAAEVLGYKTANCIHYDDATAHELQAGFERGFVEGGGTITSVSYCPADTVDFGTYLSALQPADCTLFWMFGDGAVSFVRQYHDSNHTAPLLVPMAHNFSAEQLAGLSAQGLGVGMVGCDFYAYTIDDPRNAEFIAAYQGLYPGELPTPQSFGGWQAVMLFAEAVRQTGGDTTPAKVIEIMSTMTLDTPAGKVTMSPYDDGYVGTRDFFILETQQIGGIVTWVPVHTYGQVLLGE